MQKAFFAFFILGISFTSCKKCYKCALRGSPNSFTTCQGDGSVYESAANLGDPADSAGNAEFTSCHPKEESNL